MDVTFMDKHFLISLDELRRVTRGGEGGRSPLPFFESLKKLP